MNCRKTWSILLGMLVMGVAVALPGLPGKSQLANAAAAEEIVYFRSMANQRIVCAANYGQEPLIADREVVDAWEQFQLINNSDGTIALLSKSNGKYVCADLNQGAKLIARSDEIQQWEKFQKVDLGDGTIALLALANSRYVCTDLNNSAVLVANREAVGGAWEAFKMTTTTTKPEAPGTPGKCKWAGVRESKYGVNNIGFPSPQGWANAMNHMASHWTGAAPTAIWLVGEVDYSTTGTTLQFTSPGGTFDRLIEFNPSGVNHEACLSYFDQQGIKIFLQLEPGFASVTDQINAVLRKFGHHPCVVGLAVDVEWYKNAGDNGTNAAVSDALAKQWELQVKSYNSNYRLLLKHFEERYLPPTYRGDIVFCCDDEQNGSLNTFLSEHRTMANFCYPNPVIYQIGYPSDKSWWGQYSDAPKTLGDALINQTRDGQDCGVIWVDFSLNILPH